MNILQAIQKLKKGKIIGRARPNPRHNGDDYTLYLKSEEGRYVRRSCGCDMVFDKEDLESLEFSFNDITAKDWQVVKKPINYDNLRKRLKTKLLKVIDEEL